MTERQKRFLKLIIESYIQDGEPVGSKTLLNTYTLKVSPATIRNEMAALESEGFLEKAHTSSGRVPSIKGYEYYAKNQADKENKDLTKKLEEVFMKRRVSIDVTLDEAASAISEIAGLTLITSSNQSDELMKSIQLTPINEQMATIVIVTSSGRVESKLIEFNNNVSVDDVRVAIRIFKERLVNTKLDELPLRVEAMAPILSESINNYEAVIQAFVSKIFDFHNKIKNKVYGNTKLIKKNEIKREDLAKLVDLISNKSVWEAIENEVDEDQNLKIEVRSDNTSLISKKINVNDSTKEIAIVGSNRLDYAEAKQALNIIEAFFKRGKNE